MKYFILAQRFKKFVMELWVDLALQTVSPFKSLFQKMPVWPIANLRTMRHRDQLRRRVRQEAELRRTQLHSQVPQGSLPQLRGGDQTRLVIII